jgi:hypothetical protein
MCTHRLASSLFVVSLLLGGCGGAAATTGPADAAASSTGTFALEGKSYDVALAFPGETTEKDTLHFAGGKFESTACTAVGFPEWSEYRARDEHGATEFKVVTRHPDGTTMEWSGTADATAVMGTATRTIKGQPVVGSFRGSLSSS